MNFFLVPVRALHRKIIGIRNKTNLNQPRDLKIEEYPKNPTIEEKKSKRLREYFFLIEIELSVPAKVSLIEFGLSVSVNELMISDVLRIFLLFFQKKKNACFRLSLLERRGDATNEGIGHDDH